MADIYFLNYHLNNWIFMRSQYANRGKKDMKRLTET